MGRRDVTVVPLDEPARREWEPRTRYARIWRRSRSVDVTYGAIAIAGTASVAFVVTDCVASWFGDRVLIGPGPLEELSFWTVMPGWLVLMASAFLLRDVFLLGRAKPRRPRVTRYTVAFALGVAAAVAFAIGNSAHGKRGSARVLAGPVYQISSDVYNEGDWRTVTRSQYQSFDARLVRGESAIAIFGAVEVGVAVALLRWRRSGFPLPVDLKPRAAT